MTLPRHRLLRQHAKDQPAIENNGNERSDDGRGSSLEERAADQIAEVTEHDAARTDVVARPSQQPRRSAGHDNVDGETPRIIRSPALGHQHPMGKAEYVGIAQSGG